jgi:hypothetical protein
MIKSTFIMLMALLCHEIIYAQQNVGIGTNTPNASSLLELNSSNKGLLVPRINLISETDVVTIVNPVISLLLYNTNNTLPEGEGYYFWNGTKWSKLATRSNLANLAWGIGGNAGTNTATDFIGTTDDKALVFKTNNIESGKIDPVLNNVFFGRAAGKLTTGANNSFFGHQAGSSNGSGIQNTAIGSFALEANTGGTDNIAVGVSALRNTQLNDKNTAVGVRSLFSLTFFNARNTALGFEAGKDLIGERNTVIGANAEVVNSNGSAIINSTAIGCDAVASADETMSFGNATVKNWGFAISEINSSYAMEVGFAVTNGNGAHLTKGGVWTNASDVNKKENFTDLNANDLLQKISQLNIQRWRYKGSNEYHIGPTSQDFYKAFGVGTDDKGISTIDPAGIALAAIKEQQKVILQLQAEITQLRTLITQQGKVNEKK